MSSFVEVTEAPYFFGQSGNSSSQNSIALQAAIDYAIAEHDSTKVPITLTFFGMTSSVSINAPGIVAKHNGVTYSATTVHFKGLGGYNVDTMPAIIQTNGELPCLIFQYTRGCMVEGLAFKGAINANPTIQTLVNDHEGATPWWNSSGTITTNIWRPHGAIVMDPFGSEQTTTDHYPGLSSYYLPNMGTGGSNTLHIENCTMSGFTVGIMWNPSKTTQNGDGCTIVRCKFFRCKVAIANGYDQVRMNSVVDPFVNYSGALFDGLSFGRSLGVMPEIRGGQTTICRQLFIADGSRYSSTIVGHNTEELWRLGYWGSGSTLSLIGCQLKTLVYSGALVAAPDAWLEAQGAVAFIGGRIWTNDNLPDQLNIYSPTPVRITLRDTAIEFPFSINFGSSNAKPVVRYHDCPRLTATSGMLYGISESYRCNYNDFTQRPNMMLPGAQLVENDLNDSNEYREWICLGSGVITMDTAVTVTVNGNGTGSFASATSADVSKYQVGEYIHTNTAWTMGQFEGRGGGTNGTTNRMNIGKIASIVGTTVNLVNMPKGMTTGTFDIVLTRIGAFRPRAMLTITSGSNSATISPIAGYSVGDRIRGTGLPLGCWVQGKSGGTLTLSHNATATDVVEVYDARVELRGCRSWISGPPSGTFFKGDCFKTFGFDVNASGRGSAIQAWLCVKGGNSPVFITEYDGVPSTTSTSTAYTPTIGDVGTRKRMTSGSAIILTLPQDTDLAAPIGALIEIEAASTGTVTVAAGSGAIINSRGGLRDANGQYSVLRATKIAANTWNLSGDLA